VGLILLSFLKRARLVASGLVEAAAILCLFKVVLTIINSWTCVWL